VVAPVASCPIPIPPPWIPPHEANAIVSIWHVYPITVIPVIIVPILVIVTGFVIVISVVNIADVAGKHWHSGKGQ
jgi:hypothetical protein